MEVNVIVHVVGRSTVDTTPAACLRHSDFDGEGTTRPPFEVLSTKHRRHCRLAALYLLRENLVLPSTIS